MVAHAAHEPQQLGRLDCFPAELVRKDMFVLLNTFHVDPPDQEQVLALLNWATEERVSKADGFVSAILHKSIDGTKVVMRAEWRDLDAYESMRVASSSSESLDELASLARFELGMYEVVATFQPRCDPDC